MGFPHPDSLLAALTWEQFHGWQRFYAAEPWGEERGDLRTMALAAWLKSAIEWRGEVPDMLYPYFHGQTSREDIVSQAAALSEFKQELLAKKQSQRERETLAGG